MSKNDIILEQVCLEPPDGRGVVFDMRYVEGKRKEVFNKALQRASLNCKKDEVKCFVTKTKTKAGYLGAARYGEPWPMKEISRREVTLKEVESWFE